MSFETTLFPPILNVETALELKASESGAVLNNRKNTWIQLAGHPGAFAPAGPLTIWKKRYNKDNNETKAYELLMKDAARSIVPMFHREVEYNGEYFIEMEDLLRHFTDPSIMDIKLGSRTFLESEVNNPVLRKDLYEKMVSLDPDAPTEEEKENKAVTKLRYMLFREQESSTSDFGFRIEALRMSGETPTTDLKKVKKKDQIEHVLCKFLDSNTGVRKALIKRLEEMQLLFESSAFFKSHEVIGSSILMIYDKEGRTGAWLIDFSKSISLEDGQTITHRNPWTLGNHEDGILFGIDNLLKLFTDLRIESKPSSSQSDRKETTEDTG
ncbi:hypothetical protein CHS0354_012467 [Potamilus streckersoni]|uniref:Kinase n=1 Tax=Potamilus streckersoni TaxID=2493646 RepID=A0AAE0VN13_9BIVA|nr:hypothetical protein CHS0354_012467 [Potamilus streckersoni]